MTIQKEEITREVRTRDLDSQWSLLGDAIATLSGIEFGNVSFRFEYGRFTGLIERRETMRVKEEEKP